MMFVCLNSRRHMDVSTVGIRVVALFCCFVVHAARAQVVFVISPSGTVYIPPAGNQAKVVQCRTNVAANITWENSVFGNLDETMFGITRQTSMSSIMYITIEFVTSSVVVAGMLLHGSIRCKAGTTESSSFTFAFGAVLSITSDPSDARVNEGLAVQFSCGYSETVPGPTDFMWRISDSSGIARMADQTGTPGIRQSGYQVITVKPSDAGNYTCVLTNEFATVASKPARLTVQYFGQISLNISPSTTVHDETEVTVECSIDAYPMVTEIQLSRSDGPFLSSSNSSLNRGDLGSATAGTNHVAYTFTAKSDWTGNIFCKGKNPAGNGEQSINFTVQTPPAPPTLCVNETAASTHSLTYSYMLGDDGKSPITQVAISCYEVRGDATLDGTVEYIDTASDLNNPSCATDELTGLIPGRKYRCQLYANNDVGSSTGSARFDYTTVATVPSKPILDPNPVTATETSLTVYWTVACNGGKIISEYTVRRRGTATGGAVAFQQTLTNSLSQHEGTYMLEGLARGTQYHVEIEAKNSVGSSTSVIVGYTTLCLPGTPVSIVIVDDVDSPDGSIKFMLKIPSDNGCGAISNYTVSDGETDYHTTATTGDGSVELFVSGLDSGTEYSLEVSVRNEAGGVSSPSEPVTFTTADSPSIANEGRLPIGVIAGVVAVLVVICVIITGVIVWFYRRKGETTTSTERAASVAVAPSQDYENPFSRSGTVMQQSPAYGKLRQGRRKSDSEIRMQESRAYGTLDSQVTTNNPTYEAVT